MRIIFVEIDHEIFSMAILPFQQVVKMSGQLLTKVYA